MIRFIVGGTLRIGLLMIRRLPSFRLIRHTVRRRHGHKWGVPAVLLSAPYLLDASLQREMLESGSEPWISFPVDVVPRNEDHLHRSWPSKSSPARESATE